MSDRPCDACPWVSRDERDIEAVQPFKASMEAGNWFCCHVNMGTCHGARLLHEQHVRKAPA